MDMEEQFVELCHNNNDVNHVVKGKRTKRQRPLSPCAVASTAVTSSCSTATSGGGDHGSFSSPTTTFEKEEEDMANCLILLAQGKGEGNDDGNNKGMAITSITNTTAIPTTIIDTTVTTTATATKIGLYDYECKTCNKTFSSFQALGGHMASHKRPKMTLEEKKLPLSLSSLSSGIFKFKEANQTHIKSGPQIPISLQLGCGNNKAFHGNKSKFHECSICGAEFTSGQALGGHMRRHRTSTNSRTNTSTNVVNMSGSKTSFDAASTTVEVKPRNVLEFDLNLPAPDADISDSNFQFTTTSKSMVPPALVGCRY
ncbi:hypothetical protein Lal_00003249 [Lupinus albus]|uniref:Putative transcription factor C2H2 family n=1 Tax=Lupinus albus TaxID=3870 RepID=A0A6A4NN37_LUPAL|nr:putative transcription factor C2H2 family [Lupinus albus]KAF1883067.1 hypothetical protein Lal_00003249 [Lupinus albus]